MASSTVIKLAKTAHGTCGVCGVYQLLDFFDLDLDSASVCTECVTYLDSAQSALSNNGMRKALKGDRS